MSRQVIVAGFHRSGTSLVGRLLHQAGLFLGEELLGENPSNPYGHFEDVQVVRLHDAILADNGLTWQVGAPFIPVIKPSRWEQMRSFVGQRNMSRELWGFKDPRVASFLPHWKYLLPDAKVLVVYRHFSDAASSLERRHASDLLQNRGPTERHLQFWREPDLALRMWLLHNRALLNFASVHPDSSLIVSFDRLQQGYPLIEVLNSLWSLSLRGVSTFEIFDPTITERRSGRQPVADRTLIPLLRRTLDGLRALEERTWNAEEGI